MFTSRMCVTHLKVRTPPPPSYFLFPRHRQILSLLIPTKEDVILTEALGAVHVGDSGELSQLKTRDVVDAFRSSRRRVLFLDYGGTLVELEGV